ncbi:MAG: DUF4382 domain-containing protein [Armatimonadota bacterium]
MQRLHRWGLFVTAVFVVFVLAGCGSSDSEFVADSETGVDLAKNSRAHRGATAAVAVDGIRVKIVGIDLVAPDGSVVQALNGGNGFNFDLVWATQWPMYVFSPSIITGTYEEIRIRVSAEPGDNYLVLADGSEVPLKVPSGTESGIKVRTGQFSLEGQLIKLSLDFDPDEAVHQAGNGTWIMRPVMDGSVE